MTRTEVERILLTIEKLVKTYEVLCSGAKRWGPDDTLERMRSLTNAVLEFLQGPSAEQQQLDQLMSNAYTQLTSNPGAVLQQMQSNSGTIVRTEVNVLESRITEAEIIAAIRAYKIFLSDIKNFPDATNKVATLLSTILVSSLNALQETRGERGRTAKKTRRKGAMIALKVGLRGVSFLIGNGLVPAAYTYSYALGCGSLLYAR